MLILGKADTGLNGVREKYYQISSLPHPRQSLLSYINYIENLVQRPDTLFPNYYNAEKKTIREDIQFLKDIYNNNYNK